MRRVAALCLLNAAVLAAQPSHDYPVKPVPFTAVHVRDSFWAPRIEINRKATIPFAFEKCEETGRIENFVRAATVLQKKELLNKQPPGYPFDDSDVFKVIEGAAYTLSVTPDSKLESYVDSVIAKIGAAQEADGYLYTTRTIDPLHPHEWAGTKRWEKESDLSHELYNLGHLYEAAVAWYQATGKKNLLEIALRTADLLDRTFGPGKAEIWPGHQITEMGLAKLYRVTGDERYLKLAKFLLDVRGPGREYNQAHKPVVQQSEAVGHAVRAMYMYSGMADVAALAGDASYVGAIDRIWENVVGKKLYITGGIGSTSEGEAFGPNYSLPNMSAYNETCAAIAHDYFNHRLFLLHADARYIDVLERTLYNGLLSGVSLDGKTFFYPNPLESIGQHARSPWFGCACCPSNVTRFLSSLPGYVYAQRGDELFVNLYMESTADIQLDSGAKLKVAQTTRYPWDGAVRLTIDGSGRFKVKVRIPGWARNEAVPGDLYRFAGALPEAAGVKVNGSAVGLKLENGYVTIAREWKSGDTIDVALPMPVRRVMADSRVEADRGRVALQRGPLVYAAEWVDNPQGHVRNLMLPATAQLKAEYEPGLLNGVVAIKARAVGFRLDAAGQPQREEQDFKAIPYYAWANRGSGQMTVWLPDNDKIVRPRPYPTVASTSKATASGDKSASAANDGEVPAVSSDRSANLEWWPNKGTAEWVEYRFDKPATVSEAGLFWYDDTGRGESRVPAGWRLLYRDGTEWKPVTAQGSYGVKTDTFNTVRFEPVKTTAMRLEVTLQAGFSGGVQEWQLR